MTDLALLPRSSRLSRLGDHFKWLSTLKDAVKTPRGAIGGIIMLLVVLLAVIGPHVEPYSATNFVTFDFAKPSGANLLGGDDLGRDVLSRLLDGGWVLLLMAVCSTAFGVIVGGAAGVTAAYKRGWVDAVIMRSVDVILAFPSIVLALMLVSILGPKLWLICLAVGVAHAPAVARVLRSATLDISERDYIKAIELQGVKPSKVMRSEILPNLISPLMVETGLRLTYSIVLMAGLNFLGFGQPPPAPNWGYMINENRIGITANPWATLVPAILIALLTIGMNTFTDAIARVAIGVERRPQEAVMIDELVVREAA